jgi:hypothetical protein
MPPFPYSGMRLSVRIRRSTPIRVQMMRRFGNDSGKIDVVSTPPPSPTAGAPATGSSAPRQPRRRTSWFTAAVVVGIAIVGIGLAIAVLTRHGRGIPDGGNGPAEFVGGDGNTWAADVRWVRTGSQLQGTLTIATLDESTGVVSSNSWPITGSIEGSDVSLDAGLDTAPTTGSIDGSGLHLTYQGHPGNPQDQTLAQGTIDDYDARVDQLNAAGRQLQEQGNSTATTTAAG